MEGVSAAEALKKFKFIFHDARPHALIVVTIIPSYYIDKWKTLA